MATWERSVPADGRTEVYLQLASGESLLLKTFAGSDIQASAWNYWHPASEGEKVPDRWGFHFVESIPVVTAAPDSVELDSWTELSANEVKNTMGTACYSLKFHLDDSAISEWMLDLGDVRESARIRVNGKEAAVLWSVPYRCLIGRYLHPGENILEVEVTNLPANRIADMDRRQIPWRIFKDANIVSLQYKKSGYENWQPVPSGLLGPVKLIPMKEVRF